MAIWMLVTKDKYELPLVVADSAGELGQMIGKSRNAIQSAESKARRTNRRCKYVKVEEEDDDE